MMACSVSNRVPTSASIYLSANGDDAVPDSAIITTPTTKNIEFADAAFNWLRICLVLEVNPFNASCSKLELLLFESFEPILV